MTIISQHIILQEDIIKMPILYNAWVLFKLIGVLFLSLIGIVFVAVVVVPVLYVFICLAVVVAVILSAILFVLQLIKISCVALYNRIKKVFD